MVSDTATPTVLGTAPTGVGSDGLVWGAGATRAGVAAGGAGVVGRAGVGTGVVSGAAAGTVGSENNGFHLFIFVSTIPFGLARYEF